MRSSQPRASRPATSLSSPSSARGARHGDLPGRVHLVLIRQVIGF
ncbi:hypothetical protein [Paractinoplanes toevensis]|nr:hypothetical protein [Actinoplanes toevensis]